MSEVPMNTNEPVRFIHCLPYVLKEEVNWKDPFVWSDVRHNFSNDRGDKGGKTMCGIIQREYDHFRKMNRLPVRDVRLISEAEGHTIYYDWYWCPHCGELPPGLDLSFFDSAVNMGTTEAIRVLQRAVGVGDPDGQWGPETVAAVGSHTPTVAISAFAFEREKVYREMSDFDRFGKGWTARTHRILLASTEMAGGLQNA